MGVILGPVADAGATCLVLVDADTGHLKAVPVMTIWSRDEFDCDVACSCEGPRLSR